MREREREVREGGRAGERERGREGERKREREKGRGGNSRSREGTW